jgi:hypothetical protein
MIAALPELHENLTTSVGGDELEAVLVVAGGGSVQSQCFSAKAQCVPSDRK